MKYLPLFVKFLPIIMTVLTALSMTAALSYEKYASYHPVGVVMMVETDSHIQSSRKILSSLYKDHPLVLRKFEKLVHQLKQSYLSGEGLIDSDLQEIIEAINFAARKHEFDIRKDRNVPYITHPLETATILLTVGKVHDKDIIIAALLNEVLERTQTLYQEIEEVFGIRVAGFLKELKNTHTSVVDEDDHLKLKEVSRLSAGAAQIKLAAKLDYLQDRVQSSPIGWNQKDVESFLKNTKVLLDNLPWVNAPLKQEADALIQNYLEAR